MFFKCKFCLCLHRLFFKIKSFDHVHQPRAPNCIKLKIKNKYINEQTNHCLKLRLSTSSHQDIETEEEEDEERNIRVGRSRTFFSFWPKFVETAEGKWQKVSFLSWQEKWEDNSQDNLLPHRCLTVFRRHSDVHVTLFFWDNLSFFFFFFASSDFDPLQCFLSTVKPSLFVLFLLTDCCRSAPWWLLLQQKWQ